MCLYVFLSSMRDVLGSVNVVAVRQVSVMGCFLVVACFMVLCGFVVMTCSMLMMFRRLLVVMRCFLRHVFSPFAAGLTLVAPAIGRIIRSKRSLRVTSE